MSTLKDYILEVTKGDNIIAVLIYSVDLIDFNSGPERDKFKRGNKLSNKIITLDQALAVLDYEYDAGFGAVDCHFVDMWSNNLVYYTQEYDGSTSINVAWRNPPTL